MSFAPYLQRLDSLVVDYSDVQAFRRMALGLALSGRLDPEAADSGSGRPSSDESDLIGQEAADALGVDSLKCRFARLLTVAELKKGLTPIQRAKPGPFPLVVTADARLSCDHADFDGPAVLIPMVSSSGHGNATLKRLHYQVGPFALGNILSAAFPRQSSGVSARFLYEYLTAFKHELLVSRMVGTANVSLTIGKIGQIPVPIVSPASMGRLDALMALCDELEAVQTEREARRDRLRTTSLGNLVAPDESKEHARFFLRHSSRMVIKPEHVAGVRHAILDLAVRGRLVPRDGHQPQPTSDAAAPSNDRLDLQLPNGWTWVRVSEVADARLGKMLDKARNAGRPYPYLRNTNVHWFDIRTDDLKSVPLEDADATKYLLQEGDVLICEGGHGIGRAAVWRSELPDVAFQKALHRVRPGPKLTSDFFAYCVFVYERAGILAKYFTGVGIPHFTGKALATLVFPLPPLAEQHRIVAKVDELMTVCDELEQSLATEQTERARLLEALLRDALEDGLPAQPPAAAIAG